MVELSNITGAAGLDADARLALEQLVEVYAKHQPMNRVLEQYYECKQPTPLDRPMMEAFCFHPTGTKPFGQSRITPAVRYYVDEVQRTLRYMAVSGALYATPKDILTGITDKQFKEMTDSSRFGVMVTSLFIGTRGKDGNTPDYKRLQAASPQPYIDSIATYAKLFSGATGVPLNSLGIVQDNPSSAQAIEFLRGQGFTPSEVESVRSQLRRAQAQGAAAASAQAALIQSMAKRGQQVNDGGIAGEA